MMKKRLLALLLAGLLTASLASCSTKSNKKDPTPTGGTEEEQTVAPDPNNGGTDQPVTATWTDVDETVYVIDASGLTLTGVDDGATVKAEKLEKLHRVQISNTSRSVVEKDGKRYYADSTKLTTDDILGEKFTPCDETTKYVATNVHIREYASTSAPSKGGLARNDTVKVVAAGDVGDRNWSKIKIVKDDITNYYFVASDCLANEKVVDPNTEDFSSYFTDCTPTVKYVTATTLTVRKNASTDADVIDYLETDDEVTVIATGVVGGINWSKIKIANDVKEGDTPTYTIGYVASAYLSPVKGGTERTLQDMLTLYPTFNEADPALTMYVSADSLNARTTPEFPDGNTNLVATLSLKKKDAVKVVAAGIVDDVAWAMLEYKDGEKTAFCFVSAKYLTTDPEGNVIESMDALVAKYGFTKLETPKTVYAIGVVSCKTAPDNDANSGKTLENGTAVTVYASAEYTSNNEIATWYLFKVEGSDVCYFAGAALFTESVG